MGVIFAVFSQKTMLFCVALRFCGHERISLWSGVCWEFCLLFSLG